MRYQRAQGKCITRPHTHKAHSTGPSFGGSSGTGAARAEPFLGSASAFGGDAAAQSPRRSSKRPASGKRSGKRPAGSKRGRSGRGRGREPWDDEDDEDEEYDPAFERYGYYPQHQGEYGEGEGEEEGGAANGGVLLGGGAGALFGVLPQQLLAMGTAAGFGGLPFGGPVGDGSQPQLLAPTIAAAAAAAAGSMPPPTGSVATTAAPGPVTAAELRRLVGRAAALVPELAGLRGALDALPSSALESLPQDQTELLSSLRVSVEAGISEVKAADAAVTAVSQVLEQKVAAAARAHDSVAVAAAGFRDTMRLLLGETTTGDDGDGAVTEVKAEVNT